MNAAASPSRVPEAATASPVFEWALTLVSVALVTGIYLDGWAHIRSLPESFFTPWHAIIYGSFGVGALLLGGKWRAERRRGHGRRDSLPPGYSLSLVGVAIFLVAGAADFAWHSAFGIERNAEALYSPPHLLLAGGGALIVTGPLRAAWQQASTSRGAQWRAILSLTCLLALFTFFTSELHPYVHPWAWVQFEPNSSEPAALGLPPLPNGGVGARDLTQTLGIGAFILQAGLLVALVLLAVRRWGARLPFGWLTCVVGLSIAGLSIFHSTTWLVPAAIAAGLASDLLYRWLQPTAESALRLRIFSASLPLVLFGLYFAALQFRGGVWWSPHVWLGAIALSTLTGWLVSYLIRPPELHELSTRESTA